MSRPRIIKSLTKAGEGVFLETEEEKNTETSNYAVKTINEVGEKIALEGMTCVGSATVFFYEYKDGHPGGAYIHATGVGNLNEVFCDGGVKDLSRHCAQLFGRRVK